MDSKPRATEEMTHADSSVPDLGCPVNCVVGLDWVEEEVWPVDGGTNGEKAHIVGSGGTIRLVCELRTLDI
ncbi:hypothetical protein TNCV_2883351 [Trichonephila clavipes]|nr:hypothetical protein TNCV_2883351 [Trichonephila clavipes]